MSAPSLKQVREGGDVAGVGSRAQGDWEEMLFDALQVLGPRSPVVGMTTAAAVKHGKGLGKADQRRKLLDLAMYY